MNVETGHALSLFSDKYLYFCNMSKKYRLKKPVKEPFGILDIAVAIMSIYVLGVMIVESFWTLPRETAHLLQYIDWVLCAFFLGEFTLRFIKTSDKNYFMRYGWIDLVASIPILPHLHIARVFRLMRVVRAFRTICKAHLFVAHFRHNKVQTTVGTAVLIGAILMIFSSITILQVEVAPNSNIRTAEDALWWVFVTISTVGYGDKFPVTNMGRLISMILIVGGVGLFGVFTAYVASIFVSNDRKEDEYKKSHRELED